MFFIENEFGAVCIVTSAQHTSKKTNGNKKFFFNLVP